MHFNIKKQMLEVCFLHTPTFIIEPFLDLSQDHWWNPCIYTKTLLRLTNQFLPLSFYSKFTSTLSNLYIVQALIVVYN